MAEPTNILHVALSAEEPERLRKFAAVPGIENPANAIPAILHAYIRAVDELWRLKLGNSNRTMADPVERVQQGSNF